MYAELSENVEALNTAIENAFEFERFDAELCAKICSVISRCEKCVAVNGGHIKNL